MRLAEERQKKRELWEDEDYLKQVDSSDGWKVVREYEDGRVKREKKEKNERLNALENKGRFVYLERLADYCREKLKGIDFPEGWECASVPTSGAPIRIYGRMAETKEGVAVIVKSAKGEVFVRAVLAAFDPEVDLKNMGVLAVQAENTVDSAKGLLLSDKDNVTGLPKTKSGIIVAR